jgi:hypothetical protein
VEVENLTEEKRLPARTADERIWFSVAVNLHETIILKFK